VRLDRVLADDQVGRDLGAGQAPRQQVRRTGDGDRDTLTVAFSP
jgi:hypothetical protein